MEFHVLTIWISRCRSILNGPGGAIRVRLYASRTIWPQDGQYPRPSCRLQCFVGEIRQGRQRKVDRDVFGGRDIATVDGDAVDVGVLAENPEGTAATRTWRRRIMDMANRSQRLFGVAVDDRIGHDDGHGADFHWCRGSALRPRGVGGPPGGPGRRARKMADNSADKNIAGCRLGAG